MAHIHSIGNNSNAVAQYQAYLAQVRAARLVEEEQELRRKSRMETIRLYRDRERNPEGDSRQDTGRNPGPEEENGSEDESDPTGGFGKHYA
jgi:hypothetical protein